MTLNGNQLSALVKMGVAMALADGKVEEVEEAAIVFELLNFGVSKQDATRILKSSETMDVSDAFSILSSMSNEQKKYATGYLAVIMVSDNDIDDSEVKLWQLICTLCNFPSMNIGEALTFWKNH